MYLKQSDATIVSNTISYNSGTAGGGIALEKSNATIRGNTIFSNTTQNYGGGGLYAFGGGTPTIVGNSIFDNVGDAGGGVLLEGSSATLHANWIISNTG